MKSNHAIAEEIRRLGGYLFTTQPLSCPNVGCVNHSIPLSEGSKHYYSKGKSARGSKRFECRLCGKSFSLPCSAILRQRQSHKNTTLYKLLLGKMPFSRICDVMGIQFKTLYDRINFFHSQSLKFAAKYERKLANGMKFDSLYIAVDRQSYAVNWTQRQDKRNIVLQAVGSAELNTGYVFGMHLNFDDTLDSKQIELHAKSIGDHLVNGPFRKYARLWLSSDYRDAVKETANRLAKKLKGNTTVGEKIAASYSEAEHRLDVESAELITGESKFPSQGMQVRSEYTLYAHFYWLRQLLSGANKTRFYLDQESGIRAACLSAFEEEVKASRCEAFFIRLAKEITVDQKRRLIGDGRLAFESVKAGLPGLSEDEVKVYMMRQEMDKALTVGKWSDQWSRHPFPNNSEPDKAVCWLTERPWDSKHESEGSEDEFLDHMARLHLRGSLHAIDRFFMQIRRRLSLLERPIGTSSKAGRVWYGYSAYKPENIQKLLEIFRVYYNYCLPGKDGKTPAMRLGLRSSVAGIDEVLGFI